MKRYYFVGADNKAYGPILPTEFYKYGLTADSLICQEGGNAWVPLNSDPSLLSFIMPPATPTPPPAANYYQGNQMNMNNLSGGNQPPTYLVWSILVTLFCCLPFGIVAIVMSSKVNSQWNAGDYAGAQKSSQSAKNWCIVSAVIGVVITVANFIMLGTLGQLFFLNLR